MSSPLIPCLRYADAPAAIAFLCDALGFTRHLVVEDEADPNLIHHAQLTLGGAMVMLGSDRPGDTKDRYRWKTPAEAAGITQCVCVVVPDADAACDRARAAGAEIVAGPYANDGYPGRSFDVSDPEGNIWNVTSYDPFSG